MSKLIKGRPREAALPEELREETPGAAPNVGDIVRNVIKKKLAPAVEAFVNHPEFPVIYNQAKRIENLSDRWGFLLRKAYEMSEEGGVYIGAAAQHNSVDFKRALEEYGLRFLCPYFEEDDQVATGEVCRIVAEPIQTVCKGEYHLCDRFRDVTGKAAFGEIELAPKRRIPEPKYKMPDMDVPPVDLRDLNDWWHGEGKYG